MEDLLSNTRSFRDEERFVDNIKITYKFTQQKKRYTFRNLITGRWHRKSEWIVSNRPINNDFYGKASIFFQDSYKFWPTKVHEFMLKEQIQIGQKIKIQKKCALNLRKITIQDRKSSAELMQKKIWDESSFFYRLFHSIPKLKLDNELYWLININGEIHKF